MVCHIGLPPHLMMCNTGGTATITNTNGNKFAAITASDVTVASATSGTITGDFKFEAKTPATQNPGVYKDVVVVTTTAVAQ